MKNKNIILLVTIFLLIFSGLFAYSFFIFNNKIKTQSDNIDSLKFKYLLNEKKANIETNMEANTEEENNSNILADSVYYDGKYRVYAFYNNMNALDLNWDGIPDLVFRSHINGRDYAEQNEYSDKNIYTFYIDRADDIPGMIEYYNIVTKESPGKKIDQFDRDFAVPDLAVPACNAGEAIRVIFTGQAYTILAIVKMENKDNTKNYANFELYKLKKTGDLVGSDYIFSYVKTIRSRYASCDLEQFANIDVVAAVKEAGL